MKIIQIQSHRNGVHGRAFYAVTFTDWDKNKETFIATVFDEPGHVAVYSISRLPDITFGENSWRGDEFEGSLRKAIAAYEKERELPY